MKIFLSQTVKFEGDNFPYSWTKEYDSELIPHKGDFVEDPLWKDPYEYEVEHVVMNYNENRCYVTVSAFKPELPKNRMEEFANIANSHGWNARWGNLG